MGFYNTKSNYKTSDLYLSSFLKAKGMNISNTERVSRKVFFIFENKDKCAKLADEYFNNGAVNVGDFINAIRGLKTMIFDVN